MQRIVTIDCFPESLGRYRDEFAIVAVDVIRASTTAVTAVALGRRCFPVSSLDAASALVHKLEAPLLAGELRGDVPEGFDMNNSPAELVRRTDTSRPIILLSSSGTRLICEARGAPAVYAGCLRNYTAQIAHLVAHHPKVAVIGAGSRGEFREEDQLCCAWIAEGLMDAGYAPSGDTAALVRRWHDAPVDAFASGRSAHYLKSSGQLPDLDFILTHVDDVSAVFPLDNDELGMIPVRRPTLAQAR